MSESAEELLLKYRGQVVPQSFNPGFIALSYVVSLIGAACTLELLNRRTSYKGIFNQQVPPDPLSSLSFADPGNPPVFFYWALLCPWEVSPFGAW